MAYSSKENSGASSVVSRTKAKTWASYSQGTVHLEPSKHVVSYLVIACGRGRTTEVTRLGIDLPGLVAGARGYQGLI